ncbi:SDR family oxidoreductase [Deinococcus yavapaiensis]|uniref:dTDP-4-dehydrorhamnose reductase n=1 Tax=Deinococcus yavapaiensis KR-236 TaxID=694435 RepID=A0A318SBF8_9DEIO|nr:NAD(P)-dependent oxidoreductase [Deinococcus yavapaiensis]PYE55912.1 dTDP-4-dehydrorhamnose reductase [Deinococcus yavapaiensis KR-236]
MIVLTGGSGRLGTELQTLLPEALAPNSRELDVTSEESVMSYVRGVRPSVIVHAAAYTNVGAAEREREACWRVNVVGTRHVVRAAHDIGAKLVHVSTDYVFDGERGGYTEEDPLGPPINYYALSKLVAEEVARTAPRHLVVRTSFRPREWPYETAFTDVFTSQDYVDVIAPDIALIVRNALEIDAPTLHVATERKSVFDLARRRKPDVRPGARGQVGVRMPSDVSLDTTRWQALKASLQER